MIIHLTPEEITFCNDIALERFTSNRKANNIFIPLGDYNKDPKYHADRDGMYSEYAFYKWAQSQGLLCNNTAKQMTYLHIQDYFSGNKERINDIYLMWGFFKGEVRSTKYPRGCLTIQEKDVCKRNQNIPFLLCVVDDKFNTIKVELKGWQYPQCPNKVWQELWKRPCFTIEQKHLYPFSTFLDGAFQRHWEM